VGPAGDFPRCTHPWLAMLPPVRYTPDEITWHLRQALVYAT